MSLVERLSLLAVFSLHQVLRSYDNRFRRTDRSPEIYLSPECRDIVGGDTKKIVEVSEGNAAMAKTGNDDDSFWTQSNERGLLVISTPYKEGKHVAEKPSSFLSVIDQLQKLHKAGYVHGDIRAFNTVFGECGGLIDFDFGGKPGRRYPKGYRPILVDGLRRGSGENEDSENTLVCWHDWYALGRLIFFVHTIEPPADEQDGRHVDELELRVHRMDKQWKKIDRDPKPRDIDDLRCLLEDLRKQNWTVRPNENFIKELNKTGNLMATFRGATASPLT